ncbi:MAG: efflux RND transporter permease subunit [Akkermansiaceae bacterium]|nr:efflux RND transporter permease subunit [Akkermansiaceae bacterium]
MYSFFIRRPVVAICVALMLVLGGLITALSLPVAQYPDIVPAEISISTSFPGADCQTVVDSVASPIEQQMSGVEGLEYMTSTSANDGSMSLSVVFDVGSSADMDQVLAYLRYAQSSSQLPAEVQQMGVTMRTLSGPPMLLYVLRAPQGDYDAVWLSNYAYINFVNPLLRTPGVGNVQVFGAGEYAMRIWLHPQKMAALGITVQQVQNALQQQNRVNPIGKIGAQPALPGQQLTYTVRTHGRLQTVEDFQNVILRADADSLVYLKDVARVELGCQSYNMSSSFNGEPCAIIAISQSPGSNALKTVQAVETTLQGLSLAPGLELQQALNTTAGVSLGIKDILVTLGVALALAIFVVFVFLQGWRATLIPLTAVPVSVVGTFVFFPLFGMEVNTICLMGLVLAIGLVVDDAIVVVEAVQSHIDAGESPRGATFAAMKEVSGPVVATALVLAAVFFPCMLLPGITGRLFAQFSVTIGVSILISAFTALSLSPALAALLLRPRAAGGGAVVRAGSVFNRALAKVREWFGGVSRTLIRRGALTGLLLLGATLCIYPVAKKVPGAFLPNEDEGYFYGSLQMPYASSLEATEQGSARIVELLKREPSVEGVLMVNGFNLLTGVQSSNNAFFFVALKPWHERAAASQSGAALSARLNQQLNALDTGGIAFTTTPPPIPGVGASSDVTFMLEDRAGNGPEYLAAQTASFVAAASSRPEIAAVQNLMAADTPQYLLRFNVKKALSQGVDPDAALSTLQTFLGSAFVNYFNRFGYQYQVFMQADAESRMNIQDMAAFYLPGAGGAQVPLNSLVDVQLSYGPEFLMRQNMYNASMLNVSAAPGYTAEQVMSALEETFARSMPNGMGFSYSGMSYQEKKASQGVSPAGIFALSGIFVFLLLASLYESWSLPLSIVLSVPIAILGAFATLWLCGAELDLYAEIGLIMLIGLAAKNAILVVEFAQDRLAEGMPLLQATLAGAEARLRPILMTSLAFILGCIPLALASGPGAVARQSVGITVIGGMCVATFIGVFFIPFCYYTVARLRKQK